MLKIKWIVKYNAIGRKSNKSQLNNVQYFIHDKQPICNSKEQATGTQRNNFSS